MHAKHLPQPPQSSPWMPRDALSASISSSFNSSQLSMWPWAGCFNVFLFHQRLQCLLSSLSEGNGYFLSSTPPLSQVPVACDGCRPHMSDPERVCALPFFNLHATYISLEREPAPFAHSLPFLSCTGWLLKPTTLPAWTAAFHPLPQ